MTTLSVKANRYLLLARIIISLSAVALLFVPSLTYSRPNSWLDDDSFDGMRYAPSRCKKICNLKGKYSTELFLNRKIDPLSFKKMAEINEIHSKIQFLAATVGFRSSWRTDISLKNTDFPWIGVVSHPSQHAILVKSIQQGYVYALDPIYGGGVLYPAQNFLKQWDGLKFSLAN